MSSAASAAISTQTGRAPNTTRSNRWQGARRFRFLLFETVAHILCCCDRWLISPEMRHFGLKIAFAVLLLHQTAAIVTLNDLEGDWKLEDFDENGRWLAATDDYGMQCGPNAGGSICPKGTAC